MSLIAKHAAASAKVATDDLDWELCKQVGLTDREKRALVYFADVEGQTVFYMLELLKLKIGRESDTLAFATIWNYEEYYHSMAFTKVLEVCGHPLKRSRIADVRQKVTLQAKAEDVAQVLLSRLFPHSFQCLWTMWGACNELLTRYGYEQLAETSPNPVLAEICRRVARQETRHFAWYFQNARDGLAKLTFAQRFARRIFERIWTPVGQGVKTGNDVAVLVADLFDGCLEETGKKIDARLSELPGMDGLFVVAKYAERVKHLLPDIRRVETRAQAA